MGHLTATPVQPSPSSEGPVDRGPGSGGHRWVWIVVLVALVAIGVWYFRGLRASTEAQGPAANSGSTKGQGRGGAGGPGFVVPVVVATAVRGDVPVYFNGLGTVTAFNTVTVRSRIDGQITKINFQEGQFVQQGADLVDIDSRPYQVQLEQAEG